MASSVTVKDIARLAGVSIGTVDRVIHGRPEVSEKTRKRVEEILRSANYQPNIMARHLSLGRTFTFRAILPRSDQDSGYWALCRQGIELAARELSRYKTMIRIDEFDRGDRGAYRRLLETLEANPCDGLAIAPVLPEDLAPLLARLDGRVPYAFFDGTITGAAPIASFGQDAYKGGYLAGRLLDMAARRAGPLVALAAHAEDRHIRLRLEGFRDYCAGAASPACSPGPSSSARRRAIVRDCGDLDDQESCSRDLERLFSEIPDAAGLLVPNAEGHGVGEWLTDTGRKAGCALVGWDLVPSNRKALLEGRIDCILSQRPREQGRYAIESLFKAVVRGEAKAVGEVLMPIEVYFKENLPEEEDSTVKTES